MNPAPLPALYPDDAPVRVTVRPVPSALAELRRRVRAVLDPAEVSRLCEEYETRERAGARLDAGALRRAVSADPRRAVRYAEGLARRHSEALSYIPRTGLHAHAAAGQLMLEFEGGEPCGFLIHGSGPLVRVYQACVEYDARRREHGLRLVARLVRRALAQGAHGLSLWCADDLAANEFWRAAGFAFAGRRRGGARRGRLHNRWVLSLAVPLFPAAAPSADGRDRLCAALESGEYARLHPEAAR